ncbi:MAG: esterase-like activity of phytase family protein, partial [Gemmataceae bacterium]|nr:esterase-like activity of phytase family protein [Gemmataceae bacterium]
MLSVRYNPGERLELGREPGGWWVVEKGLMKVYTIAPDGSALTGLPNINFSPNANLAHNDEVPVDANGVVLPHDPLGADLEGIVVDPNDGTFWMVDEHRPAIYHFGTNGIMINRYIPIGTHAAAGVAYTPGTFGLYGTEVLPAVLGRRRQNRGFEAVAFRDGKVYAMMQSPLRNPISSTNAALNARQTVRLVEFDPVTRTSRQFLYRLDNVGLGATRGDKVGDMVAHPHGGFLLVERDDDFVPTSPIEHIETKIYHFDLAGATPITAANDILYAGKTLDQMTLAELTAAGIVPIAKTLNVELARVGYNMVSKVEGLTIIDAGTIAVLNDNDFGTEGEESILGLIRTNTLDASDADAAIHLRNWPIFGMYQPKGVSHLTVAGEKFLITANQGAARDLAGFSEAVRVGTLDLNDAAFTNEATLKNNINLGRLLVTRTLGDLDNNNDYEQLYAFGARSFSVWNADGQLIFDSGSDFEVITAAQTPALFNSAGSAATFDLHSPLHGPQPVEVAVGLVSGQQYAFITLAGPGGIMVYDVTQPNAPKFVDYVNTAPHDRAPQGIVFIGAAESPIGRPLVITGNRHSATAAIFQVHEANLVYAVPPGPSLANLVLRRNAAQLELIDSASGKILLRQALAATHSLTILGDSAKAETLTIDFSFGGPFELAGGVTFHAGTGSGDVLRLIGTPANDVFVVGSGSLNNLPLDTTGVETFELHGLAGDDLYRLASRHAVLRVFETSGTDTLDFAAAHAGVFVDLAKVSGQPQAIDNLGNILVLRGPVENVVGSRFADHLRGSPADNHLHGGAGNDLLLGEGGDDLLDGGDDRDTLFGGDGHDILLGGAGSDSLFGGRGHDLLIGGIGRDVLQGDAGDDLLVGAATLFDFDLAALNAIRAEWTSPRTYEQRVQNLRDGSGTPTRANGPMFLNAA